MSAETPVHANFRYTFQRVKVSPRSSVVIFSKMIYELSSIEQFWQDRRAEALLKTQLKIQAANVFGNPECAKQYVKLQNLIFDNQ